LFSKFAVMATKSNWKGILNKAFLTSEFDKYCETLQWTAWRPSFIVLHNTAIPSLADRPNGFSNQNMKDLETYYRDVQKWFAGPHLFIDDVHIWCFTLLTVPGTHSPSWNKVSLGIEMLGNYEKESFSSGRGLEVRNNVVSAIATLSSVLGLDPSTMKLHREDPLTTHACPGKNVRKWEVIQQVHDLVISRHSGEHILQPA
jgi:hypothetical protein